MFNDDAYFRFGNLIGYRDSFTDTALTNEKLVTLLQQAMRSINLILVCFDDKDRLTYANSKAFEMFNVTSSEELEKEFLAWIDPYSQKLEYSNWCQAHESLEGERVYDIICQKLYTSEHKLRNSIYIIDDCIPSSKNKAGIRYRQMHDPLTGLLNREGFYHVVEEYRKLHKNDTEPHYLIITNIRDFKLVNQMMGDKVGDSILKTSGRIIRSLMYADDIYGRLYADKFAIFVSEKNFDKTMYRNMVALVRSQITSDKHSLRLQAGIYKMNSLSDDVNTMCDKAMIALKSIISEEPVAYTFYDPVMMEKAMMEKTVVTQFDKALKNGEFRIYLQPQMNQREELIGCEALVRWKKDDNTVIPPNAFIPVLEKSNLISRLDVYVWELAAIKLREWRHTEFRDLYISVNISPRDMEFMDVYEVITGLVTKYEIDPTKLHLEITETVIMRNPATVSDLIMRLKEAGFIVEIDDFGSGYSSLNMLKDIKADVVKIDMGFLRKSANEDRSRIILDSVIYMAKRLGMGTVTEGVETMKQLEVLSSMGCDVYQGYLFSKPLPVMDFEKKYCDIYKSVEII
ncbi:GGDEF domain-containing protein [Oribacterium sp. WCC10]|uniref:GGDEF domain-containing protein n=1 Tax=Oribacterium sp. WCC10 TaxID=1855343 RepID=UPI0008DFBDF6|nr:GGDEF domain-containing protein [Oribacterium sp. WCC10]SFG30135.1 diguanylate cyclase (GGDEF) domain-containing protein [Oribacterium sp. WCC10]